MRPLRLVLTAAACVLAPPFMAGALALALAERAAARSHAALHHTIADEAASWLATHIEGAAT